MATAPVVPVVKKTWLQKAGSDLVSFFHKIEPIAAEAQMIATPFENIYAPGLANAINIGFNQVVQTEALAEAAAAGTGSGPQKLAAVIAALAPQIAPTLAAEGFTEPTSAEYTQFVNGLVLAANAFSKAPTTISSTNPIVMLPVNGVTPPAPVTGAAVV